MKKSIDDRGPFDLARPQPLPQRRAQPRSMSGFTLARAVLRELCTWRAAPRVPEPLPVMDDPERVAVYVDACRDAGIMGALHLFHACHVCDVIRPGETVLDLGCGPALQLVQIARLNPRTQFIGVDSSPVMLARARESIVAGEVVNVELRAGDITAMPAFGAASIDAVISTMTLHHLPDEGALAVAMAEAARVLKPGGGLYLADVGHLKSERSMRAFAYQYADDQPALFTTDYMDSLRAAFHRDDFRRAAAPLAHAGKVFSTFFLPYMLALKSAARRSADHHALAGLRSAFAALPRHHRGDIQGIDTSFRARGMASAHMPR